jgi:hypothetical protein
MTEKGIKFLEVKVKDDNDYWLSIADAKIQKVGSITRQRPDNRCEE